jgi:hypothetical protein
MPDTLYCLKAVTGLPETAFSQLRSRSFSAFAAATARAEAVDPERPARGAAAFFSAAGAASRLLGRR